jgi:hypothetical protein
MVRAYSQRAGLIRPVGIHRVQPLRHTAYTKAAGDALTSSRQFNADVMYEAQEDWSLRVQKPQLSRSAAGKH